MTKFSIVFSICMIFSGLKWDWIFFGRISSSSDVIWWISAISDFAMNLNNEFVSVIKSMIFAISMRVWVCRSNDPTSIAPSTVVILTFWPCFRSNLTTDGITERIWNRIYLQEKFNQFSAAAFGRMNMLKWRKVEFSEIVEIMISLAAHLYTNTVLELNAEKWSTRLHCRCCSCCLWDQNTTRGNILSRNMKRRAAELSAGNIRTLSGRLWSLFCRPAPKNRVEKHELISWRSITWFPLCHFAIVAADRFVGGKSDFLTFDRLSLFLFFDMMDRWTYNGRVKLMKLPTRAWFSCEFVYLMLNESLLTLAMINNEFFRGFDFFITTIKALCEIL